MRTDLEEKRKRANEARREFHRKAAGFTEPRSQPDWQRGIANTDPYHEAEHEQAMKRILQDLTK